MAGSASSNILSLLIYLPTALLLRLLCRKSYPSQYQSPTTFLLFKSVLQIILLLLGKTVKVANPLVHSCLFIGFMVLWLEFSLKTTCYNYRRTDSWHALSLIAVLWAAVISLIQTFPGFTYPIIWIVLLGGWGAVVLFVFIYQLLLIPSQVYRKQEVDALQLSLFFIVVLMQSTTGTVSCLTYFEQNPLS